MAEDETDKTIKIRTMSIQEDLKIENPTDLKTGLSSEQAAQAEKNMTPDQNGKSVSRIVFEHVFTFFNLLNVVIAVLIVLTGSWRNLMFMGVVISNTIIGLWQELHSRKILRKLAIISQARFDVRRDGKIIEIPSDEIAAGDLLILSQGCQIPVDGIVVSGQCQVNESMLTGESDEIDKQPGSELSSGSFVTAGSCTMQVLKVGVHTYMYSILEQAKRTKRYPSQLRDSLDEIIRFCTIILIPTGLLLFGKMFFITKTTWRQAVLSSSASMIGMIPEGLVILTSVALFVSVSKLAREQVLVQELYCIETLARVSTLCLDKTGTITTGNLNVDQVIPMGSLDEKACVQALSNLYHGLDDDNATAIALHKFTADVPVSENPDHTFPFSSRNKFSGATFENETWIAGAYSFIYENPDPEVIQKINDLASQGKRVLALARTKALAELKKGNYELVCLFCLEDEVRPDARKILNYFKKQDVNLKVISGDNPVTVAAIARRAGIEGKQVDMAVYASEHPDGQGLEELMEKASIFGRVSPEQKKQMVLALKRTGQVVAMTGDGVNDVPALKEADCSIAMGTGTQAARSVASVVLLKDQFDALPSILLEGRRVINNIQRTASLFLVKTLFSFGLSILTLFWLSRYPFEPIQLTLVSFLGVGFPSFVLTLEPNHARIKGNFLVNVLSRAFPGAISMVLMVILTKILQPLLGLNPEQFSSACTWAAGLNALWVLFYISQPLTKLRKVLLVSMWICFLGVMVLIPKIFSVVYLTWPQYGYIAGLAIALPFVQRWLFSLDWSRLLGSKKLQRLLSPIKKAADTGIRSSEKQNH